MPPQSEWVSGNIFIRPNRLEKAGDRVDGHTHNFDHTTIVYTGAVTVKATLPDGTTVEKVFSAPSHFLVRANVTHEITALEDETVCWCVYSHRNAQAQIVEYYDGWAPAYR